MRIVFYIFTAVLLLSACTFRYYPRKPSTGLPPSKYVAVINLADARPDMKQGEYLCAVRSIDWGYSINCSYIEIVEKARRRAMPLGANCILITRHEPPEFDRSDCSGIEGNFYYFKDLSGKEAEIFWSADRPLTVPDLRARPGGDLPPVRCNMRYRLMGDFVKNLTVRTITTFYADSTALPDGPEDASLGLRRAQLHFNLAELESRKFKVQIEAMAPDVGAISKNAKTMLQNAQNAWHARTEQFDSEYARASSRKAVLDKWEATVNAELEALAGYADDRAIKLESKKR